MEQLVRHWWPGWNVISDGDRFETQLEACASRLEVPVRAPDELLSEILEHVNWVSSLEEESGTEITLKITGAIARRDYVAVPPIDEVSVDESIEVSPLMAQHTPVPVAPALQERILDQAVTQLRSRLS
jgi:hypothetical protein